MMKNAAASSTSPASVLMGKIFFWMNPVSQSHQSCLPVQLKHRTTCWQRCCLPV
jgi:hypothetical protein